MILQFIKDNWLIISGGVSALIAIIAIPALRGVAWKALQLALMNIGKAFMKMLTADFFTKAFIWALDQLAKKTKGDWDDKLVAQLKEQLEKKE